MAIFKIAKTGGTVNDAEKDLAFTSDRSCLVELFSGYVDIETDGYGNGTGTFKHDLGYLPIYYCFVRDPLNTTEWYPNFSGGVTVLSNIDTVNLNLTIDFGDANSIYRVFYSVLGNQLEDSTGSMKDNVSGKVKIAKDGYNADTEKDARNMKFFSGKNVYKIDPNLSGSYTFTVEPPDIFIEEIEHNLGYVPMVFVINSTFGVSLPNQSSNYWVDSSKIYIYHQDFEIGDPYDLTFKYQILRDKIA